MFERSLDEAERILAVDKDIIVPVKKVWQEVVAAGRAQDFTVAGLADFTAMIEADPRFEFFPAHRSVVDDIVDPEREDVGDEQTEMELLGFYSGDRIKLRRIQLTPDALGEILRTKVDRTMDALSKVWELRPQGDVETEEKLLDILAQAQSIQQEVQTTFSPEKMKSLSESLKKIQSPKDSPGKPKAKKKASPRRASVQPSKKKKTPARSPKKSRETGRRSASRRPRR
ncbi:MAG: hypothetical protein FJ215_04355 [Ignavibacteria bacterium]|nr:hypothetical protein [Ignavibacteria bacterium]